LDTVTYPVTLTTLPEDVLQTDRYLIHYIGTVNDPLLGRTTASLYAQWRLEQEQPSLGTTPQADSIVMQLSYSTSDNVLGKRDERQTWNVFEVQDDLNADAYYSDAAPALKASPVGTYQGAFPVGDTVLRIPLNKSYGQQILDAGSALLSQASFLTQFKGLAILPDTTNVPATGAVIPFNTFDARTKLTIYYHNAGGAATFNLLLQAESRKISTFRHNHSGKSVFTSSDQDFIEGLGGTKVKVDFGDSLKNFAKRGNYAIHRAEVLLPGDKAPAEFPAVGQLYMYPRNAQGQNENVPNTTYVESLRLIELHSDARLDTGYRFLLSTYLQDVVNQYRKQANYAHYGMNLFVPVLSSIIPAGRAVLHKRRATLKLIYSKVENP
jgi:hypothetical protein